MSEKEIRVCIIIALILCFISIFYTTYQFLYLLKQQEVIRRAWEKSIKVLDAKNQSRKKLEKQSSNLYGDMERKTVFAKIDALLSYSGLYTRFPKLTAEKCMASVLIGSCMEGIILWFALSSLWKSLFIVLLTLIVIVECLNILCAVRRKRIDGEVIHCIDMMEMGAQTSTEVIQILRKSAVKVREPLRSELLSTVVDAENCGNSSQAIRRLCNRIDNKYLKDILLNLDICSKFKANYQDVLRAGKRIVKQDVANREEIKKLYINTSRFIVFIIGIGLLCLMSMGKLTGTNQNVFIALWNTGTAGQVIIWYLGIITIGSLWRSIVKAL